MNTQLKVLARFLGKRMYRAHFRNRCLQSADADSRRLFTVFPVQVLDRMWDTLEDTVEEVARRWSLLQQVFDVYNMCFGVDGKQLDVYKEAAAMLKDSDLIPRLEILRVASKCIGKRARWMMGCDCHEAAL